MLVHDVGFASGIMSRLTAHPILCVRPLELTVLRQRSHVRIQRIAQHHHSALDLALRLATSLFGGARDATRLGSPAPLGRQIARLASVAADSNHTSGTVSLPALAPLRFVFPRSVQGSGDDVHAVTSRAGGGALTAQRAAPRPSLLAGVAPLRRVLRASPDARSERRPPSDPAAATTLQARPDRMLRDRVTRAPQPIVDVNGLTDQVIRAIDRRIIAQRERLGRP